MHSFVRAAPHCMHPHVLQALADYAVLIEKLKHEWESPDSAVIGFGGSYGGMLAAWFRMKYPNVLDGEHVLGQAYADRHLRETLLRINSFLHTSAHTVPW